MSTILQGLRFFAILGLIATFLAVAALMEVFPVQVSRRRYWKQLLAMGLSRISLGLLGVNIDLLSPQRLSAPVSGSGRLLVANHLSYLDVLILVSLVRTSFVTSVEVRDTPGLGLIARLGGCIFVERRSRENLTNEVGEIARHLDIGENVTVFPEATSTNGDAVLPFKRAMFRSVEGRPIPVIPMAIRYTSAAGAPLSAANRDWICWYGSMDFLPHLWSLCSLGEVGVRIDVQSPLNVVPHMCRKELAEHAHQVVAGAYAAGAV